LEQSVFIYSMWKEYVNIDSKHANRKHLDFMTQFH